MAASKINWAQFISDGSQLPPDVTFAVMEQVNTEQRVKDQTKNEKSIMLCTLCFISENHFMQS